MDREGGHSGTDGDRTELLQLERGDPVDDRFADDDAVLLVASGQEQRELVATEPEGLAVLPQARGELRQNVVARRVAETVVDALEVVDVDEAERELAVLLAGAHELELEPVVEVPVIAKPGERIGEREAHGPQRVVGRALVQADREQRPDQRSREAGRALPHDHEDQRRRGHQRERNGSRAQRRHDRPRERAARARSDRARHERHVQDVLRAGADRDLGENGRRAVTVHDCGQSTRGSRREREGPGVEGDPCGWAVLDHLRERRGCERDDHTRVPAEQDYRADREHEPERDTAGVEPVERHGETG